MGEVVKGGIEQFDAKERWRCPLLEGPVHFGSCRQINDGLPCARILECWLQTLPLVEFLKVHYSPDQLQRALTTTKKKPLTGMVKPLDNTIQHVPSSDEPRPV